VTLLSRHRAALLCAAVLVQGCATGGSLSEARNQFFSGQPQAALTTLETDPVVGRNQLLGLLDKGLIAHTAGDYAHSVIAFKAAADLSDQLDFISVREQSTTLVTNDWASTYKGEFSERLWIHTFQMMNFLLLDRPESAAVEARQALKIYDQYGDDLNRDWYTRTLIAMSFEAAGAADSAHIEYKKLLNDAGRDIGAARRAWQNAKRLGRKQDANTFKDLVTTNASTSNSKGELVVFVQTGAIPHKTAGSLFIDTSIYASFPIYPVIPWPNVDVTVIDDGVDRQADIVTIQTVNISRDALAARGKQIATKQLLRIAAKKGVAAAVSGENELLGGVLEALFFISEIADTRSWETMPAHISLVQVPLVEGDHSITLRVRDGSTTYDVLIPNVNIKARQTSYRSLRVGAGSPRPIPVNALANASAALPAELESAADTLPTPK